MESLGRMVRELCAVPTLLWLALQDKRHLGVMPCGLLIASICLLVAGQFGAVSRQSALGGVMIGAVLMMFAYFSKEAIGMADAVIVLVCGAAFGLLETVMFTFLATLYAGIYSGILLLAKKAGKNSRIPFLPFLFLGYITMRVMGRCI